MSEPKTFTEQQLKDWEAFERIRTGGRWNMFDPNARRASGLGRDEYMFCMKNYSALKEAAKTEVK